MPLANLNRAAVRLAARYAGVVCILSAASALHADTKTATWLGGAGSWSDPTKWSGGVVPGNEDGTTFDVNIDGGNTAASTVAFPTTDSSIGALTIDAGDALLAPNYPGYLDKSLSVAGPLTVNGTLRGPVLLPADSAIGGTGTLLAIVSAPTIRSAGGSLTIGSGVTIHGYFTSQPYFDFIPRIGAATVANFFNNGRIVASPLSGSPTAIGIAAGFFDNRGTIELSDGGQVFVDARFTPASLGHVTASGANDMIVVGDTGLFDLDGGAYTIDRADLMVLNEVRNGTLHAADAAGRSVLIPYLRSATFDNVTLDDVDLLLDGAVTVKNGLHGKGVIRFRNPEAIEGLGTVTLNRVEPGITVEGSLLTLTQTTYVELSSNEGRIRVSSAGQPFDMGYLRLRNRSRPGDERIITNTGTLELSRGGRLSVVGDDAGFFPPSYFDTTLSFGDGGSLVMDAGGLLEITGDLDLAASTLDALLVLPRPDGSAYDNVTIVTYTRMRLGIFDLVTPGISVFYGNGFIAISGTPVPEPTTIVTCVAVAIAGARRRSIVPSLSRSASAA